MRILLLKPKHIGDSLLLTPTIIALRLAQPDAEIWVVVRRGCEGILAGCPEIDRLLTVAAIEKRDRRLGDFWSDLKTIWALSGLSGAKFDYVFELGDGHRSRGLARVARGKRSYSVKPTDARAEEGARKAGLTLSTFAWETRHRVEKDFYSVSEFLPLAEPIPPLRFDRAAIRDWEPAKNLTDFVVMQIGKRQSAGRWMRERWEDVGRWLLGRVGNIVIATGPSSGEVEEARWLRERLGPRVLATEGRADWSQTAGLLYRARLYVGTDTATMHLAAACQCPIVALFGSTWEGNWGPWKARHRIVSETDAAPTGDPMHDLVRAKQRTMAGILPAKVIAACEEFLE